MRFMEGRDISKSISQNNERTKRNDVIIHVTGNKTLPPQVIVKVPVRFVTFIAQNHTVVLIK